MLTILNSIACHLDCKVATLPSPRMYETGDLLVHCPGSSAWGNTLQLQPPISLIRLRMPQAFYLGIFGINISFANSGLLFKTGTPKNLNPQLTSWNILMPPAHYRPWCHHVTVSPSAAIRLTATAACQIIADQDRHVRIANLSLVLLDSALVGGSLFSPTAISIIHKTSQHLLSEDGQSLAPFNIMRCIAVFQPRLNHPNWCRIVSINHCQLWPGVAMSLLHHPQPIGSQEFQMQNRKKNMGPN